MPIGRSENIEKHDHQDAESRLTNDEVNGRRRVRGDHVGQLRMTGVDRPIGSRIARMLGKEEPHATSRDSHEGWQTRIKSMFVQAAAQVQLEAALPAGFRKDAHHASYAGRNVTQRDGRRDQPDVLEPARRAQPTISAEDGPTRQGAGQQPLGGATNWPPAARTW